MQIEAIIFDWGRTLYEETGQVQGAAELLEYCKAKEYRLVLASLAHDVKKREDQIRNSGLRHFFEKIRIAKITPENAHNMSIKTKDAMFDELTHFLSLPRNEILIIGDRAIRDVKYANQYGHPSIWVKRGKFAHELPNDQTGQSMYTVSTLEEIKDII